MKLTLPMPELAPVIRMVFPSRREALNTDILRGGDFVKRTMRVYQCVEAEEADD